MPDLSPELEAFLKQKLEMFREESLSAAEQKIQELVEATLKKNKAEFIASAEQRIQTKIDGGLASIDAAAARFPVEFFTGIGDKAEAGARLIQLVDEKLTQRAEVIAGPWKTFLAVVVALIALVSTVLAIALAAIKENANSEAKKEIGTLVGKEVEEVAEHDKSLYINSGIMKSDLEDLERRITNAKGDLNKIKDRYESEVQRENELRSDMYDDRDILSGVAAVMSAAIDRISRVIPPRSDSELESFSRDKKSVK